ncbi:MAG TPA: 3-phosphoserine/phosphohydroxythreonine transaminase [Actinomycetota bacterium]|nr:3-phosphoserine/phosphohydroxythreonine transaminase [Actinomycetota bacterium]
MTERIFNFSPGPGTLPLPVLEQAQRDLVALPEIGASPLEVSHRGAWFTEVIREAEANLRELLAIPEHHHVLFCQGGATMQFSMCAMNLLRGRAACADYVLTGSWGEKAIAEASKEGATRAAWSDREAGFVRVPSAEELTGILSADAAYVHVTTNETIQGVEFPGVPTVPDGVPLVADASSDFLSRPLDVGTFGLLYAGAQKNAGPAGATIAVIRDDLLAGVPDGLPSVLDYRTYVEHGSLYNTPSVFAIYVTMLVTRWLREEIGGLDAMARINASKAALLYDELDGSAGFYRGHAEPGSRSLMNVTFRLPTEDLERTFVDEAAAQGLAELKGHRSVGGIRASIYNAMPVDGVEALVAFMRSFRDRNAA